MPGLNNLPASIPRSVASQRVYLNPGPGSVVQRLVARRAVPAMPPISKPVATTFVCMNVEPEDAKITGGTRSLSRRLLALNMRQDA